MTTSSYSDTPEVSAEIYRLFREFFDRAEKKRRWALHRDIPWEQANRNLDPSFALVVESFCAVELYLPDYLSKMIPQIRSERGPAWFMANWGYEESKHSLALGDWLLHSKMRTEEQRVDLEKEVFRHEWNLPMDNPLGMVCYSMVQELATWLHYRNLRLIVGDQDPALNQLLGLIVVDERAHYDFFRKIVKIHLREERGKTLEQLKRVLLNFAMPAVFMLADSRQRVAAVKEMHIFDDDRYYQDVFLPILQDLGVDRQELRRGSPRKSLSNPSN